MIGLHATCNGYQRLFKGRNFTLIAALKHAEEFKLVEARDPQLSSDCIIKILIRIAMPVTH